MLFGALALVLFYFGIVGPAKRQGVSIPSYLSKLLETLSRPRSPPPRRYEGGIPAPTKFGNIPQIEAEAEEEPDLSGVYVFPNRAPPSIRYEDFNRRLVVYSLLEAHSISSDIAETCINDEPLRAAGSPEFLLRLARTQFRPAYPTLIDTFGHFATQSAQLEREPLFSGAGVKTVLDLPEEERPVIISVKGGAGTQLTPEFILMRHGFEDFHFDPRFLGDGLAGGLPILFRAFIGPPNEWMYFSRARLRHVMVESDKKQAAFIQGLRADAEAARLRKAQEEMDDSFDSFADLWGIAEPKRKAGETNDVPKVAETEPHSATKTSPQAAP